MDIEIRKSPGEAKAAKQAGKYWIEAKVVAPDGATFRLNGAKTKATAEKIRDVMISEK